MFHQIPVSLQAEILSIVIGIMRKSERNLLVAMSSKIYEQTLEILCRIDDNVVADLLIDLLTVMTTLSINAQQFKLLLQYLKTENQVWVIR